MAVTSFTAEPSHIKAGETATLKWTTTDASECYIMPPIEGAPVNGDVTCNGEGQVNPTRSTVYYLGTHGSAPTSRTVLVYVDPAD